METKTKQWTVGTGSATIVYGGQGDGNIIITSDANSLYEARSMQITVETTNGSPKQTKTITINQAAKLRIDLSAAVVTAANQTYSGGAKTPVPTVSLNGSTVPSTGYDVSYSNNTNAGTATITVTGKGDYTGTATGTFTINKASRTLSFANSYMVLNTSSTGTNTAAPSAGSGDGAITYSIANTTYATINSSTGAVTSKTSDGSVTVTATIAAGTNYQSATAIYTLYVFATTHNYSYTGSAQSVTLPPGTYQFQCWGAQGGTSMANSTYNIPTYRGGYGGYSVGQLTVASAIGVKVNVGGQGGQTSGGFNGGGTSPGTSQHDSNNEFGITCMAGGGGASDIRLSDNSLYSRMIVAGGGAGGAYCCRKISSSDIHTIDNTDIDASSTLLFLNGSWENVANWGGDVIDISAYKGYNVRVTRGNSAYRNIFNVKFYENEPVVGSTDGTELLSIANNQYDSQVYRDGVVPNNANWMWVEVLYGAGNDVVPDSIVFSDTEESVDYNSFVGPAGGGNYGNSGNTSYAAGPNAAGSGGSFGQGANQTADNYRYCSAAGGGGWYGGGGGQKSDSDIGCLLYIGGGSGFVNTYANRDNRPSGYTGLQLDSGSTTSGSHSFPAPGGGTEIGHSGNGYVRITRIS